MSEENLTEPGLEPEASGLTYRYSYQLKLSKDELSVLRHGYHFLSLFSNIHRSPLCVQPIGIPRSIIHIQVKNTTAAVVSPHKSE